ncbi:MAG: hypothetical protein M3P51_03320 [Chloroflexota bacterium]|nr:hypothetical protein [Chloroflexota bacterium]
MQFESMFKGLRERVEMLIVLSVLALVRAAGAARVRGRRAAEGYGTLEFAGLALLVVALVIAADKALDAPIDQMFKRLVGRIGNIGADE